MSYTKVFISNESRNSNDSNDSKDTQHFFAYDNDDIELENDVMLYLKENGNYTRIGDYGEVSLSSTKDYVNNSKGVIGKFDYVMNKIFKGPNTQEYTTFENVPLGPMVKDANSVSSSNGKSAFLPDSPNNMMPKLDPRDLRSRRHRTPEARIPRKPTRRNPPPPGKDMQKKQRRVIFVRRPVSKSKERRSERRRRTQLRTSRTSPPRRK